MSNSETLADTAMTVFRKGADAPIAGPAEWFTGTVRIDRIVNPPAPARASVAIVNFEPGARTNWHTHPLGQTLVVTAGTGWTQCEGGPKTEIRPGDMIWCNCGRRHWHGATDKTAMQHVAVTEALDGVAVDWMEPVSDEDYLAEDIKTD